MKFYIWLLLLINNWKKINKLLIIVILIIYKSRDKNVNNNLNKWTV